MIEFRDLTDDHPDLKHSPLLRAALLTLQYAQDQGPIGLTKTKAFKRVFVHWAAEQFDWPGMSSEELFRYNKVLNEYEFPPLELLHFLLVELRLARHYKGEFRLTKRGAELARSPGRLFAELIPFFVLNIDHASYSRFDDRPVGNWDVWLNVINVEADHVAAEQALYATFYGEHREGPDRDRADWDRAGWDRAGRDRARWREIAAFVACVLRPLEWSGLLLHTDDTAKDRTVRYWHKTPLWRSALKLETDEMLPSLPIQ